MTPLDPDRGTADLHVHSRCSDGALTPTEVVRLAADRGLRAVALTDHDTIDGNDEAADAGARFGVEVLAGVEISTHWGGVTFHMLGYGIRPDAPGVRKTFDFLEESRRTRNPRMVERLQFLGIDITMEEILGEAAGSLVGRPHFARVLLRKGVVSSMQEAFDRFLGRGAPAYVNKERLSPADACRLIATSGGVAVLAHPGLIDRDYPGRFPGVLQHLLPLGLDGIEAHYSRHSPGETSLYLAVAQHHGLLVTGGSDFHQQEDTGPDLGVGFGSLRVPYRCFLDLRERLSAAG
ncbi:MAG: PHP domain-containing protein [Deltaproteobacteria bacterium]|nr:PHP domain-containing protein [Deltaproteobacteria bacterium]